MGDIALVGIGRALSVEYDDADGPAVYTPPPRTFFAWWGPARRGNIVLVRVPSTAGKAKQETLHMSGQAARLHRQFHDSMGDVPALQLSANALPRAGSRIHDLGRVRAIVYETPKSFPDSNKHGTPWRHAFGDFGDGDDKSDQARYWPMWGQVGHAFIIAHRPGNAFRLGAWVIG